MLCVNDHEDNEDDDHEKTHTHSVCAQSERSECGVDNDDDEVKKEDQN